MPEAAQIDAPLSLASFFPDSDSENDEDKDENNGKFDQCFETQTVELNGQTLLVRQYVFHSHNANRVWPGTFNLLNYLLEKKDGSVDESACYKKNWGSVLELGTATGILAIRLAMACSSNSSLSLTENSDLNFACNDIVTSDVDDEYGEVQDNVKHNFKINNFRQEGCEDNGDSRGIIPPHITHTWGTGWRSSAYNLGNKKFDTIVASDILLYVSAYDALVKTLLELFETCKDRDLIFVMSWNRRMKESATFFELIKQAGFACKHEGKCIYTITKEKY